MRLTVATALTLSLIAMAACNKPAAEAQSTETQATNALAATDTAAPAAAEAGGLSAPNGDYECWANGQARMLLNFTVTAPGKYTASDGTTGTFTIAPDGVVTFTGYEAEVMPANFTIVYHVPEGHPTFSFRGNSGEAAFCEHA